METEIADRAERVSSCLHEVQRGLRHEGYDTISKLPLSLIDISKTINTY